MKFALVLTLAIAIVLGWRAFIRHLACADLTSEIMSKRYDENTMT